MLPIVGPERVRFPWLGPAATCDGAFLVFARSPYCRLNVEPDRQGVAMMASRAGW